MNRSQARSQAREEYVMADGLRRLADTAWVQGRRAEAERLYAQASQHDAQCDEFCRIAAGTQKVMDAAPVRPSVIGTEAPDDF